MLQNTPSECKSKKQLQSQPCTWTLGRLGVRGQPSITDCELQQTLTMKLWSSRLGTSLTLELVEGRAGAAPGFRWVFTLSDPGAPSHSVLSSGAGLCKLHFLNPLPAGWAGRGSNGKRMESRRRREGLSSLFWLWSDVCYLSVPFLLLPFLY